MPITTEIHWEVRLFKYKIDDTLSPTIIHEAIFDTGSSLTYVPQEVYDEFRKKLDSVTRCMLDANRKLVYCNCFADESKNPTFP